MTIFLMLLYLTIIFCVQNKTFMMCLFYARHHAKWLRKMVLFSLWPLHETVPWLPPSTKEKIKALGASKTGYFGNSSKYESRDLGQVLSISNLMISSSELSRRPKNVRLGYGSRILRWADGSHRRVWKVFNSLLPNPKRVKSFLKKNLCPILHTA